MFQKVPIKSFCVVPPRVRNAIGNNLAVDGRRVRPTSTGFFLADVGSTVTMAGSFTGSSLAGIGFTKDGVGITSGGRFSVAKVGNKYQLTITNVREDDNGVYAIVAENEAGTASSFIEFEVVESGSPRIERQPTAEPTEDALGVRTVIGRRRVFVTRGQRLTIASSATGNPTPTITWLRDGKPLRTNNHFIIGDDGSLTITKVANRDAGIFEIQAENSAGFDEETIEVVITSELDDSARKFFCELIIS